jgi:hypothetical protein
MSESRELMSPLLLTAWPLVPFDIFPFSEIWKTKNFLKFE